MFISYAQNFEDVMLWRALKHIGNGFYIDAGAASPDEFSVTKAFYERGWRGINIEPNPEFHKQLQHSRPRDTNLQVGLGDRSGEMILFEIATTGLSTFVPEIAESHANRGYQAEKRKVSVLSLAEIWHTHVTGEVHFLKVDVEGFEEPLLRGNNWKDNRPWIIVVESTRPMTQTESFLEWQSILTGAAYRFVYFDGLNRFYLAEEHSELSKSFSCPPNIFDQFKLAALARAESDVKSCREQVAALEVRCAALERTMSSGFLVKLPKFLRRST